MTTPVQLAMYKGKGNTANAMIRYWTNSQYSHCELAINGVCYSSSSTEGGVRDKVIDLTDGKWKLLDLPWADENTAIQFFNCTKGNGYDWLGIFGSQFLNRREQDKRKYFCSEWCASALALPSAETYSPQSLLSLCLYLNESWQTANERSQIGT